MARKKNRGKGFALGALIGGLFGGTTALLFAPQSGKKLRKDLAKKCHKAGDKAHHLVDDVCKKSAKVTKQVKGMAKSTRNGVSKRLKRK